MRKQVYNKKAAQKEYAAARALIVAAKDKPCADCGERYPPYVMDFDHRDPVEKHFAVGASIRVGRGRLLAEIEKCDVVCSNCHRERTHGPAVYSW